MTATLPILPKRPFISKIAFKKAEAKKKEVHEIFYGKWELVFQEFSTRKGVKICGAFQCDKLYFNDKVKSENF